MLISVYNLRYAFFREHLALQVLERYNCILYFIANRVVILRMPNGNYTSISVRNKNHIYVCTLVQTFYEGVDHPLK